MTDTTTGETQLLRRIELRLFEKRDGDRTLAVLTNLPETVSARHIAEIYRQRWTIEKHFQFLTESLHCEIPGLGKPRGLVDVRHGLGGRQCFGGGAWLAPCGSRSRSGSGGFRLLLVFCLSRIWKNAPFGLA